MKRSGIISGLLVITAALFLQTCDNSLQPVDRETEAYSIYGVLDLNKERNYIRVRNLNTPLSDEPEEDFEGQVVLQDLTRGSEEILDFRRVEFEGTAVFNFFTDEPINENTEYRVTVRNNGPEISGISVKTPSYAALSYQIDTNERFPCFQTINIDLEPVAEKEFIIMEVGFVIQNVLYRDFLPLPAQRRTDGLFEFSVTPQAILDNLSEDPNIPFSNLRCSSLSEQNVYIKFTHLDDNYIENETELDLPLPGNFQRLIALYEEEFVIPIGN